MLTPDEVSNLKYTYQKLFDNELINPTSDLTIWEEIDTYLEMLEWLDDLQVYKECCNLFGFHKDKKMGCAYGLHPDSRCFSENILDSVKSILNLYKETKSLHPKNRYILCYYLVYCQAGQIVELTDY